MGTTVPTTRDHSVLNPTPIPIMSLHERRRTPSTLTKLFHQWSILPLMANEIPPYKGRSSDSAMHIKRWPTLRKIWQNSKSSTGICDGKNTTPSERWLAPMLIDDSSHVSSTTPPYPPISPAPCSMQASQTSLMDGSMVQNTNTPTANGAHEWDTQPKDVPKSHSVSSAMVPDTLKCTATIPTSIVEKGESAAYPTTILVSPTSPVEP